MQTQTVSTSRILREAIVVIEALLDEERILNAIEQLEDLLASPDLPGTVKTPR
jgi:hypothetical protein